MAGKKVAAEIKIARIKIRALNAAAEIMHADLIQDIVKLSFYINQLSSNINRLCVLGVIKREPCIICGSTENNVFHHPAYSSPLSVVCVCKKHHRLWHVNRYSLLEDKYYLQFRA